MDIFSILFAIAVFATIIVGDIINEVIFALTPLIVILATKTVTHFRRKLPDYVVVLIVVPAMSSGVALLHDLLGGTDIAWYLQAVYGLLAVYFHQVYKKLSDTTEHLE